jgi:DNA polymerase
MLKESGVSGLPDRGSSPFRLARQPQGQTADPARTESSSSPAGPPVTPKRGVVQSSSPVTRQEESLAMPAQTHDLFLAPRLQNATTLDALRTEIGDCRRCKLCHGRTNIVFGVGNPQAELMFVGEGPGRDEDLKGEPFVGRAGQLLTEIITKGMKMKREEVYIANVVKCRPPENRNPEPDEIAACQPFLLKQIEIVKPRIIVALGTFAAQTLLQVKTPISRLRGVWHTYHGVKLMPTLHPAYLLRNPNDKRLVWYDIQAVLREMGRL